MKTTANLRRVHVLVLRGERFAATSRGDAATATESMLQSQPGLQVTIATAAPGQAGHVGKTSRPDVILLDGVDGDPVDVVTELDEALSETPVLVTLDEDEYDRVQACVVAGARGCLIRPFDGHALVSTILQVHEKTSRRRRRTEERASTPATGGRLIAVRGTKGGVGATAIAASLAVAIRRRGQQPTAVVDGNFFGGDIPVALNLAPNRSVADLIPHLDRLDDDLLDNTLALHASGVAVLAPPAEFEHAESIRSDEYQQVLEALRLRYAYVIVDCSAFLDQNSLAALDMADTVLLVTTPEIAALKNAARLLQLAARLGYEESKMRLVVNRFNLSGAIAASDFEHHLAYRASFRIPNDAAVTRALARGEPTVTFQSSSPAARALDRLACTIIANHGWEGEHRQGGLSRLANWRPFTSRKSEPRRALEAA